jgi:putative transposase
VKVIKYSYKFRISPTEDQKVLLNKHFGCVRWSYNYFLNQRKEEYLNNKKTLSYNQQSASLTLLKKEEETQWLKEVNAQSLQYSLKFLDQAYQNFFAKRTQFPKFKSRRSKNSFCVPQDVRCEGLKAPFFISQACPA